MPVSLSKKARSLANTYFEHILDRNLAAAERILADIRQTMKDSAWERGYINALEGILVAHRSGDMRYVFLSRLDMKDHRKVDEARRCFQAESRNPLQGEFDRGFFTAWSDFMRVVKASEEAEKDGSAQTLNGFIKE